MDRGAMSHKNQDRPRSEEAQRNKELQRLRGENKKLAKDLARARKELAKYHVIIAEMSDQNDPEPMVTLDKTTFVCHDCGSEDLTEIQAGAKRIRVCKSCLARKVVV